MAIGKKNSFATLQPVNDPLLGTLQNIEQVGFQKRAEDRLLADKKKLEEEKKLEEDLKWDGKFDPTIVGNSKIDDPMLDMASKARNEVGVIRQELRNPNLPYERKLALNSRLNKITQSFEVANQTPKIILERAKEIAKNIDKYDQEDVSIIEAIAKQLETGKYEVNYDENGTGRVKIFKTDESGKPIGILKETTLGDLANEFQPGLKSNFADILKKEVDNTAMKETVVQNGFTTITNKKVDDAVKIQRANAFGNLIANTPQEARHIAKKFGIDINDKEAISKKASEEFINALDVTYKKDIDQAGILAAQKEARDRKKEEIQKTIAEFSPIVDEALGRRFTTKNKNIISFPEKAIPFKNLGGSKSTLNSGYVSSFVLQDNGEVVVAGKALIDKGQKFKVAGKEVNLIQLSDMATNDANPEIQQEAQAALDSYNIAANYKTFVRKPSGDELGLLAAQAGYSSVNELEGELKKLNKNTISNKNKGSYDDL